MLKDIVISLCANANLTSPGPSAFVRDENINPSDSDYKSDQRVRIADCRALSSEIDNNMQNNPNTEDVSHPPVCGGPSRRDRISGAARALSDVAGYTELRRSMTDDRR